MFHCSNKQLAHDPDHGGRCKIRWNRADIGTIEFPRFVQFKLCDFGSEMPESSDFEIPDFLIPDFRFHDSPIDRPAIRYRLPSVRARDKVQYLISFLFAYSISGNKREKQTKRTRSTFSTGGAAGRRLRPIPATDCLGQGCTSRRPELGLHRASCPGSATT